MQSLRQRTHNYLQAWLVRLFVNRLSNSYIKTFIAKTGQPIRSYARGRTSAVAVIASVDWAVEYPFPVPPKVQVSLSASKQTQSNAGGVLHSQCVSVQ